MGPTTTTYSPSRYSGTEMIFAARMLGSSHRYRPASWIDIFVFANGGRRSWLVPSQRNISSFASSKPSTGLPSGTFRTKRIVGVVGTAWVICFDFGPAMIGKNLAVVLQNISACPLGLQVKGDPHPASAADSNVANRGRRIAMYLNGFWWRWGAVAKTIAHANGPWHSAPGE